MNAETVTREREPLMSAREVARYLGVPLKTLYTWRSRGGGPPAFRVGRHLRYERAAVRAWLLERGS